jgi:protein O-GlcNAc transferase
MPEENAEELFHRGNALYRDGDLAGAAECYRRALRIDPSFAAANFNLGCTLDILSGPAEALPQFEKACALRPEWFEAHQNYAFALARVGRMPEAVAELQLAADIKPADAGIHNNLGLALSELGRGEEAFTQFQEAIQLNPLYPEAHNNLAVLFERYGRTSEAVESCRQALKIHSQYPEALNNLGNALKSQGKHAEAIRQYREALRLRPDYSEAESSLLFSLCYPADIPEEQVVEEHLAFGARHSFPISLHENDRSPDRALNIGYVSADFRSHAVARFIEPVLRHHDRSRFRIFCYSNVSVPDSKSMSIAALADHFVNIAGLPDEAVAAMTRRDGIDILVDLSGHTAGNRLLLFARKPAPLQVTWLGYPHTTGLRSIDYRITDAVTDPPRESEFCYAEQLLRLPRNFSCFEPPAEASEAGKLPLLSNGYLTFGSFNNPAKITDMTVALWGAVLQAVPGSRLLVKGYSLADPGTRHLLLERFKGHGIAADRLELHGNTPSYRDHLALYGRVDIALDTFPYNGTTTTCEALWMGVPVVTLMGGTHRSRVGASLLRNVGLEGLVAHDAPSYREAAAALASDTERLEELRRSLRQTMAASPLTDGAGFTRDLEGAFREIWQRWCDFAAPPVGVGTGSSSGDHEAAGNRFLQQGGLDDALRSFVQALKSGSDRSALGGMQAALDRMMAADLTRAVNLDAARLSAGELPVNDGRIKNETLAETAAVLAALGFVTPADLACRYLLDRGYQSGRLSRTLAEVALSIGQAAAAASHFQDAIGMGEDSIATRIGLTKATALAQLKRERPRPDRFLLIKAWGYGFWSDVNHVLGQLLLAEMTGRIPVVHWGGNSLFSDDPAADAFVSFFQPLNSTTFEELAARCRSFYPPKWNAPNLNVPRLNQMDGAWSRYSSLHTLEREEDVVVSDFHYAVNDLAPWIAPGHRLHGMSTDELYLYLFRRYLKVRPSIAEKVEVFYRERMAGKAHLALHIRGGDKEGEDRNLAKLNSLYHAEIERQLQRMPQARLLLLTDDRNILASYLNRYGDRVLHTGATRTDSGQGVHYQNHASRYRLGEEVLIDALLACRCEGFIGNGLSNVSCAIAQMKPWGPGTMTLLGARLDRLRQITLYRS